MNYQKTDEQIAEEIYSAWYSLPDRFCLPEGIVPDIAKAIAEARQEGWDAAVIRLTRINTAKDKVIESARSFVKYYKEVIQVTERETELYKALEALSKAENEE